jgi:hypothetical protein
MPERPRSGRSGDEFRIRRPFPMRKEGRDVQRLTIPTILAALLIGLATPAGALAQQASRAAGIGAPVYGAPTRHELLLKGREGGDVRQTPDADPPPSLVCAIKSDTPVPDALRCSRRPRAVRPGAPDR